MPDKKKYASANMQPCKDEIAELHNARKKKLDYVRKELSPQNTFVCWIATADQMITIKKAYEEATGQHLQPNARPIQEIVIATDENTTSVHLEKFCLLIQQLGMTPLSYAIHMDEGHYDALTGDWIPNYHAHVIVDTTCWVHRQVERTKKKGGKSIIDPETHKPVKVTVDGYAKTIKFTREDMSRLQDFAAEATGLERPPSSHRHHVDARRYKTQAQVLEIKRLAGMIEEQQKQISANDNLVRDSFLALQAQAKDVIETFRRQADLAIQSGFVMDEEMLEERNRLAFASAEAILQLPIQDVLHRFSPIITGMVTTSMAAATIATTLTDQIQEKNQILDKTMKEIKKVSLLNTMKKSVNAILRKPVDKQIADVMRDRDEGKTELSKMKDKVSELTLAKDKIEQKLEKRDELFYQADEAYRGLSETLKQKEQTINESNVEIRLLKSKLKGREIENNRRIAENLVDNASPEQIRQYEQQGLMNLLGNDIWENAKSGSALRKKQRLYGYSENPFIEALDRSVEQKPRRSRGH